MKSKIVAIIPIRKNSQRIKNKNFKKFFKNKSLLEIKIEQLKKKKKMLTMKTMNSTFHLLRWKKKLNLRL